MENINKKGCDDNVAIFDADDASVQEQNAQSLEQAESQNNELDTAESQEPSQELSQTGDA